MSFLMFNQGEQIWAEAGANKTAPQDWLLKLYTNDVALTDGLTEDDFDEADFDGYPEGGILLEGANWVCTPGAPTLLEYAEQLFEQASNESPGQWIYGAYLVQ